MNGTQHARIVELCAELRLTAVADLYGATAQAAAAGDASFSDFLEETLRGEREVRRGRAPTRSMDDLVRVMSSRLALPSVHA